MNRKYLHQIAIVLIGLIVYGNGIWNGFVWDDYAQIIDNPAVHRISNIALFFTGSTFYGGGSSNLVGMYYRPIMTTVFSILYTIASTNPAPYHAVSIALHIFNALLVYTLLKRMFVRNLSLYLALIFLIHPIQAEAVNYISALGDLLTFAFGMSGALLITRSKNLGVKTIIYATLLFLASLLSKETGLLLIGFSAIYRMLYYGNRRILYWIPALLNIGMYVFMRTVIAHIRSPIQPFIPIMSASPAEKAMTAPRIISYYINTYLYPYHLATAQNWVVRRLSIAYFYIPLIEVLILLCGIGYLIWLTQHTSKYPAMILYAILLMVGIGAHTHIVPLYMTVADRWFYIPIVGLTGMLGVFATIIKRRLKLVPRPVTITLAILILVACAARTYARGADWHNGYTLYSHDIMTNTDSFDLENNLGNEYYKRGDLEQAAYHFQRSINLTDDNWIAMSNLATVYFHQNKITEAQKLYEVVIDNSDSYSAYQNMARLLVLYDTPQHTIAFVRASLVKFPNNARLWAILSVAYGNIGDPHNAREAAMHAYTLDPVDKVNIYLRDKYTRK